ncbi:ATP-dependent DNA helicase PIF6-like [Canna indica]|uniref:ATP-dependent DNA helicase PIF6-like n=1 Tax=Canna indica TaxID=4628 RepID=A0AAQ3K863_9LILI|nr:ATP-dependent DNA helicase PIF6-like [Canna indica]
MLISNSEYAFDELVDFVYPHLLANMTDLDYFKERTILCPTLEVVDRDLCKYDFFLFILTISVE